MNSAFRRIRRRLFCAASDQFVFDYVLWWFFFFYLVWMAWLSLDSIVGIAINYKFWILVAGAANAAILVLALATIDAVIARAAYKWLDWLWGGGLGVIALGFYADVLLFRMMGIHLPTGLRLLLESGWSQLLLTVQASGVRPQHMRTFAWLTLGAFTLGAFVTRGTRWLSGRTPLSARPRYALAAMLGLALVLTAWEVAWERDNPREKAWEEVHRVLPFALNPLHHMSGGKLEVGHLRPPRSLHSAEAVVAGVWPTAATRPDIFVFVFESTRRDYLTSETAPNLARFAGDCLRFRDSVSSANSTHLSWFSLLTANQPLYFAMVSERSELWGSTPLRLLRHAGYEVHALASAYLGYHNVGQMVFGRNLELANSVVDAAALVGFEERPARDEEVTRRLIQEIPKSPNGRLFLVFYDSTHHDYYWPENFPVLFKPCPENWKYFQFNISSNELVGIKNRYRNAVHFADSLFGTVIKELKSEGRYDDALIFATGDHGEEFLEHGKLVHASALWREQIEAPFLLKLPKRLRPAGLESAASLTASHVDFFPTVLDCLGIETTNLFDGQSLFRKTADFVLAASDNGARDPYRFVALSGDRKAWFRYPSDSTLIALERSIVLEKVTDTFDREVPGAPTALPEIFGAGLVRLYPEWRSGLGPGSMFGEVHVK